jgi:hypothetical protein
VSVQYFRSRRVVTPEGVRPATIEVRDGVIAAVHPHDHDTAGVAVRDGFDGVILPGLVDSHVHVNEPGRTEWEGFATATRAAAAGGVTSLADMPLNSIPATTSVRALAEKRAAARGKCAVDTGFLGGVIPGNAASCARSTSGRVGVQVFSSCPPAWTSSPAARRPISTPRSRCWRRWSRAHGALRVTAVLSARGLRRARARTPSTRAAGPGRRDRSGGAAPLARRETTARAFTSCTSPRVRRCRCSPPRVRVASR